MTRVQAPTSGRSSPSAARVNTEPSVTKTRRTSGECLSLRAGDEAGFKVQGMSVETFDLCAHFRSPNVEQQQLRLPQIFSTKQTLSALLKSSFDTASNWDTC